MAVQRSVRSRSIRTARTALWVLLLLLSVHPLETLTPQAWTAAGLGPTAVHACGNQGGGGDC